MLSAVDGAAFDLLMNLLMLIDLRHRIELNDRLRSLDINKQSFYMLFNKDDV